MTPEAPKPDQNGAVQPTPVEQGEFSLDLPKKVELSEQEFIDKANFVVREFGIKAVNTFYQTVREGRGKEILGTVSQRGDETEIALESNIEHMFANICDANKLPVYVISEHHEYKSPKANGENLGEPKHIAFVDPIDDTREYEQGGNAHQGLPAPLWTVASIYSLDGKPVSGIIGNLKEKKLYIAAKGKNSLLDLETGKEEEIKPSERTSIKDKDFCLATYVGTPKYAVSSAENLLEVQKALRDINNNAVNQPHTGCSIFGPMAEGTVDAYLMAREPVSEQLPGWVFAMNSGFKAWKIDPATGTYEEIVHDLNHFKNNPDAYRNAKMSYYLVTRFDQVRDEIIELIVKQHQKSELQKIKDAFIAAKSEEFEIFRASQQRKEPMSD